MYDWFVEFFVLHPRRLVAVGKALVFSSSAVMLLGVYGNMYIGVMGELGRLSHHARTQSTLATLLPNLPTWWIPETFIGFVLTVGFAGVGVVIAQEGKALEQFIAN